jgi:hypothetical protein
MTSLTTRGFKINWKSWTAPGSYTWQVPAGVYWIKGYLIGGGGGGGGGSASYGGGGGGGGASIYAKIPVTPGEIITIKVGAGGSGGTGGSNPTAGENGTTSIMTFNDNTTLQAGGGFGGGAGSSTAGGSGGNPGGTFIQLYRLLMISNANGATGSAGSPTGNGYGGGSNFINVWETGFTLFAVLGDGGNGGGLNGNGTAGNNGAVLIWWEE